MLIADLHIHSRYSRATSREITVEELYRAAQLKGIGLLGSGDITHPAWFDELSQKLELTNDGRYILKPELSRAIDSTIPAPCQSQVSYVLSGEISCIYKKNDKTRKIHCLVIPPNLQAAAKLNQMLDKIGNIKSDGRPILGLDARDLLEICLTAHPDTIFIPAHIWTPWFSLFGSKSGFNTIEECFADLTPHITALETGLSSDPAMNWQLSALDGYTLVSNSDAHSLETLAREANLLNCEPTFTGLRTALQGPANSANPAFIGTIEFFPDEGKYHLDGHRACGVRLTPQQTIELNGICPVCRRPLTVGVLSRVEELADREAGYTPQNAPAVESLTSLKQTLGQVLAKGASSKAVAALKEKLLTQVGNELHILRQWPLEEAARMGGELLAEALRRLRAGEVILSGGYDGLFGTVELFNAQEREEIKGQMRLLGKEPKTAAAPAAKRGKKSLAGNGGVQNSANIIQLDEQQLAAVGHVHGHALVNAGPGAGKTRVLVERVKHLLGQGVLPEHILVITFTRKAAAELKERLGNTRLKTTTFHGLGFELLGRPKKILDEQQRLAVIKNLAIPAPTTAGQLAQLISLAKQKPAGLAAMDDPLRTVASQYSRHLQELKAIDMDDLVWQAWRALAAGQPAPNYQHILIDEYQDVNPVQVALLRQLAAPAQAQVFAIGDPRQAIYAFRGADSEMFHRFAQDFAHAQTFTISRNYRSQASIVELAAQLADAEGNPLYPTLPAREQAEAITLSTPQAEARFIAQQVMQLTGGMDSRQAEKQKSGQKLYAPKEIAVLYRLHQQAPLIQQALEELGIPVQVAKDSHLQELEGMDFSLQVVSLLSIHAAKGLEFPVIFISGLEHGLLPYQPPGKECNLAEENNLLFVALTRARERLFITRSQSRVLFGQTLSGRDSPLWLKLQGQWLKEVKPVFKRRKPKQIELFS